MTQEGATPLCEISFFACNFLTSPVVRPPSATSHFLTSPVAPHPPSATCHLLTLLCSPFSNVSVFDKTALALSLGKLFCNWFLFAANLKIVENNNTQPLAGTNSTFHCNSLLISTRHFNAVKLCLLTIKIDLYTGHFARTVFMMISNDQI